MDFTLRQLEALLTVAKEGSLNGAADALMISQVAVSGLIKTLETGLNISLLDRKRGTRATLTPEGRIIVAQAEKIMNEAKLLHRMSGQLGSSESIREINIGARPYLIDRWLRDIVAHFQQDFPSSDIRLIRSGNEEIVAGISDGHLALGIVMQNYHVPPATYRKLGSAPASLYVSARHALALQKQPDFEQINAHGFIGPPAGSAAERAIRNRLLQAGFASVRFVARAEYAESLKLMTIAGAGIGILFDADARNEVTEGSLVRLDIPVDAVDIWMTASQTINSVEQQLMAFIAARFQRILLGSNACLNLPDKAL